MPTASLSRREPQQDGNGVSTNKGFTVIELMVVIAVVAIITSLAFPSYRALIQKRQVTSGAEQIAAFVSAVQIESVMRNERLVIDYDRTDGDTWCMGLTTNTAAPYCDCTQTDAGQADFCAIDSVPRILTSDELTYPDVLEAINGDGKLGFDPIRGLTGDPTNNFQAGDTASFELESDSGKFALNVEIGPTGRVRICSDASGTQVPGYAIC